MRVELRFGNSPMKVHRLRGLGANRVHVHFSAAKLNLRSCRHCMRKESHVVVNKVVAFSGRVATFARCKRIGVQDSRHFKPDIRRPRTDGS